MQKIIEVWLYNKCHKIYLSGPFGVFCLYIFLNISYLRERTIETSSLITVLDFQKKSWGQLAPKFSFLVARTSILVAKIIFKH